MEPLLVPLTINRLLGRIIPVALSHPTRVDESFARKKIPGEAYTQLDKRIAFFCSEKDPRWL